MFQTLESRFWRANTETITGVSVLPKFPSGLTPGEDAKSFEHLLMNKSDKNVHLVIIVLVLENKRITTTKESLSEETTKMKNNLNMSTF